MSRLQSYLHRTDKKKTTNSSFREPSSDINKTLGSPSVTSNHRVTHNHDFEWNNVKILDFVPSYNKKISKMVHIKKQQNELNPQNDSDFPFLILIFPYFYFPSRILISPLLVLCHSPILTSPFLSLILLKHVWIYLFQINGHFLFVAYT